MMNFRVSSVKPSNYLVLKVSEFIGQVPSSWKKDLIFSLFSHAEAEAILNIPFSACGASNKMIWHFHSKEIYMVKLGYLEYHKKNIHQKSRR